ncbi:hypothetical protein ACFO4E_20205 [Nocardiopsis mangrovi]|uniref:Uncharacterized protein n=1 Tax=Nocardiopsis mangrovi TaxID=1179818 RepID=A0ABV9DZ81_9ACTN
MNLESSASPSPLRPVLAGFAAGAGGALAASLLSLLVVIMFADSLGPIAGGMIMTALVYLLTPVSTWLVLRMSGAASPLLTALLVAPFAFLMYFPLSSVQIFLDDWLWQAAPDLAEAIPTVGLFAVVDIIFFGVLTAIAALVTSSLAGANRVAPKDIRAV